MSQYDHGEIDPDSTSGTDLAAMLSLRRLAQNSGHVGTVRPAYLLPGGTWTKDMGDGNTYQLMLWDGDTDIILGTVNRVANTFTAAISVTLTGLGGVPTSRAVNTTKSLSGGGNLGADRTLELVNDNASPGATRYYGTDGAGAKGFHPMPVQPRGAPTLLGFWGPGSHWFTPPANISRIEFVVIGGGGGNSTNETLVGAGDGEGGTWVTTNYPGGWGAVAWGSMAVTPGAGFAVEVGNSGANSPGGTAAGGWGGGSGIPAVWCEGGRTYGVPGEIYIAGGANLADWAPMLRNRGGSIAGAPGVHGLVAIWGWP